MSRQARIVGSFAIVMVVYFLYSKIAVPLIEPPADPRRDPMVDRKSRQGIDPLMDREMKRLQCLFPPGSWELDKPNIFYLDEGDRVKLLLKNYETLADGRVKITPCTLIFGSSAPAKDEDELLRQSIILQAPEGALLRFDPPFSFNKPNPSTEFKDGQLCGPVTISSQGKSPGPEDDLRIEGKDLFLTREAITTPNPVAFRFGLHHGRGSDLVIKLMSDSSQSQVKSAMPNVVGIQSIDFQHVEELSLNVGQKNSGEPNGQSASPIVVHCQGPFHFDATKRVARFTDHVEVMRANSNGPRDQILCDVLSIRFMTRTKPAEGDNAKRAKEGDLSDLEVELLAADGKPVIVSAPSEQVNARGQHLEYHLVSGAMRLNGGQEVMLQREASEIHAPSLFYQADPKQSKAGQRLGRVEAPGPGWLRAQSSKKPVGQEQTPDQFELIWKGQLTVEPDKQNPLYDRISVNGDVQATFRNAAETGQISAQELFVWLIESPPKAKGESPQLRPHHLLAQKDVVMNSQQLAGQVEQLKAWFVEPPAVPAVAPTSYNTPVQPQPQNAMPSLRLAQTPNQHPTAWQSMQVLPTGQAIPAAQPNGMPISGEPLPMAPAGLKRQRFKVEGRLLQIEFLMQDRQSPVLSRMTLEEGVHVTEIETLHPTDRPVMFSGSLLDVTNAQDPEATIITLTGQPAHFEARGLGLTGSNINVNRGANRMWIDGPGQMDLPLPPEMQAKTQPPNPSAMFPVSWQRGMTFDGRVVRLEQNVVVQTPLQRLCTETMDVQMQQPIRFAESKMQQEPRVEELRCLGGAVLDNLQYDERQQLVAKDRLEISDFVYHVLTGVFEGGSGNVNSVRLGGDDVAGNPAGSPPSAVAAEPPARDAAASAQLHGLYITFHRSLSGNLQNRSLTFRDRVRSSYAPVQSWDAVLNTDNPDVLGPKGMILQCDAMTIRDVPTPLKDRRSIELEAADNAVVVSTSFTATANNITYDQAKDLLILKGDGRNNAHVYRQTRPGAPRDDMAAQRFFYNRKTNHLGMDAPPILELNGIPMGKAPGAKTN